MASAWLVSLMAAALAAGWQLLQRMPLSAALLGSLLLCLLTSMENILCILPVAPLTGKSFISMFLEKAERADLMILFVSFVIFSGPVDDNVTNRSREAVLCFSGLMPVMKH